MSPESAALSGPEDAASPAEFAAALSVARNRLGLTVREVAAVTGTPASTLGGYFSGRHLPSLTQPEAFAALLRALHIPDADVGAWRDALIRAGRNGRGLRSYPLSGSNRRPAD